MTYRMFWIDAADRSLGTLTMYHVDDVRLFTDQLMCFAAKLNGTDDLYAIEKRVAQHYFLIDDTTIFGTGLVVGCIGADFLPQPRRSLAELTEIVQFGSLPEPVQRKSGYFQPSSHRGSGTNLSQRLDEKQPK